MRPPVLNESWPEEVKALYRHDIQEMWDPFIAPNVWNQYRNQIGKYFELVKKSGRAPLSILDVGCAQGTLALLLAEAGHEVVAVDIRESFLQYARSRYTHGEIRFVCGNALELDLQEQFDVVFANQIIEHLVYPERLVQGLLRLLKPAGMMVVTTPNWYYFLNGLPSFKEIGHPSHYEHLQFSADADGHFFAYKARELVSIMARSGLSDISVTYFESPIIAGHVKIRHLHRIVPTRLITWADRLALATPWRRYLAHQLLVTGHAP